MATCNSNALLASGACYQCLSEDQFQIAILQLLCDIAASGGGGGGGGFVQVFNGNGDPVAPPANVLAAAIYTDLSTGVIWSWNTNTLSWF